MIGIFPIFLFTWNAFKFGCGNYLQNLLCIFLKINNVNYKKRAFANFSALKMCSEVVLFLKDWNIYLCYQLFTLFFTVELQTMVWWRLMRQGVSSNLPKSLRVVLWKQWYDTRLDLGSIQLLLILTNVLYNVFYIVCLYSMYSSFWHLIHVLQYGLQKIN